MNVFISVDDLYPAYEVVEASSPLTVNISVDPARAQRWREVIEAYHEVREEIEAQINKEKKMRYTREQIEAIEPDSRA